MLAYENTSLRHRLAAEFRAEAARQNLTASDIARATGTTRQTAWNQLKGKTTLSEPAMAAIAAVLGIPLSELMRRAEQQFAAADTPAGTAPTGKQVA